MEFASSAHSTLHSLLHPQEQEVKHWADPHHALTLTTHYWAHQEGSDLNISKVHVQEHLRNTHTHKPQHCVGNETHLQSDVLSADLSPLMGRSLVLLNSVTASVEKPALKSRLLTPVTRSVCRPLDATYTNITHLTNVCVWAFSVGQVFLCVVLQILASCFLMFLHLSSSTTFYYIHKPVTLHQDYTSMERIEQRPHRNTPFLTTTDSRGSSPHYWSTFSMWIINHWTFLYTSLTHTKRGWILLCGKATVIFFITGIILYFKHFIHERNTFHQSEHRVWKPHHTAIDMTERPSFLMCLKTQLF